VGVADGLISDTEAVGGQRVMLLVCDYTVFASTRFIDTW